MKRLIFCCLCILISSIPAAAQSAELGISGGFSVLGDKTISKDTVENITQLYDLKSGIRIGARMAFNPKRFMGHEFAYSYQHSGLQQILSDSELAEAASITDAGRITIHNAYYNLVMHATGSGSSVRPFVTGGGGFSSFFLPGQSSFSGGGDTKFGYNYGGGIKLNFLLYGIRLDYRIHVTGKPFGRYIPNVEGLMKNSEISATFSFLFG
jgi:hypothetical protein